MNNEQNRFRLPPRHHFVTSQEGVFYKLEQGRAEVYLQPVRNGERLHTKHFCTLRAEDPQRAIPSLCHTDEAGCLWQLAIRAGDEGAEFTVQALRSNVPQRVFLERRGITTLRQLGYAESLIRFYCVHTLDATQTL